MRRMLLGDEQLNGTHSTAASRDLLTDAHAQINLNTFADFGNVMRSACGEKSNLRAREK
jgi:hypothetical protein